MKNILFAIIFALVLAFSTAEDIDNVTTTTTTAAPVPVSAAPQNLTEGFYNYSGKRHLFCNYNSKLSANRPDKYNLDDVDSTLCSHVIYKSASLDPPSLTIDAKSLGPDFENILKLKAKGVQVILSLGGSTDLPTSQSFSKIVNDGSLRTLFVSNTVNLMKTMRIDGLDVDWTYPTCWEGYCAKGHGRLADKRNFVNLLRDLRTAFRYYGFQLMVSVSPIESVADQAYDVPGISFFAHFINLKTYDFNSFTYTQTSLHSAFQGNPSTVNSVEYWLSRKAFPTKLIVGIPTFGRTFTLAKEGWNTVGAPAVIGKATGIEMPGTAAYFEICKNLDYQFVEKVGSYAYKADQWVSFDDITTIKLKGEYITKKRLAGAMITSLDTDDYSGTLCGQGKYPLKKALREAIGL